MHPEDLMAFEYEIAALFNDGKIRAPVHLYSHGACQPLIDIFKDVKPEDWVLCSWRSHLQCLLKGVPPLRLKAEILDRRSISLCFPEYRILCSAIVGGHLPIAIGIALSIKRSGGANRVWCFYGDMTSRTGIAHECAMYAMGHDLPITFVEEDNGKSVCTDTAKVWGGPGMGEFFHPNTGFREFKYDLTWPHAGAGKRVQF